MSDSAIATNTSISELVPPNPAAAKRRRLNTTFGPGSVDGQLITEILEDKFTYLWSIKNFSAVGNGADSVRSPIFTGGGSGYRWELHLELKDKKDDEDYVSISLRLIEKTINGQLATGGKKVMVKFHNVILDVDGNPFGSDDSDDTYYDFSASRNQEWTQQHMHRLADIITASERLIANNTMKIHCSIALQAGLSQRIEKGAMSASVRVNADELTKSHKFELAIHLNGLLSDSRFADVAISTSTRTFMVHKAILIARSPVFNAMLSTAMLESNQSTIEILDFDEDAVKGMLEFIYTGEAKNIHEIPSDLLQIAEKYDLKGLREDAELVLVSNLNVENAAETLALADVHNAKTLKLKAIQFIKQNEAKVKTTTSFQDVARSNPNLIVDIYFAK